MLSFLGFIRNIMFHWIYLNTFQKAFFSIGIIFLTIIGIFTLNRIFNEAMGRE
jgi:hypothetical protein